MISFNLPSYQSTEGQEDNTEYRKGILLYDIGFNTTYSFRSPDIDRISFGLSFTSKQDEDPTKITLENVGTGDVGLYNLLDKSDTKYAKINTFLTDSANDIVDFQYMGHAENDGSFVVKEDGYEYQWFVPQRDLNKFSLNTINLNIKHLKLRNYGYSSDLSIDIEWEFWVQPTYEGLANTTVVPISLQKESSVLQIPNQILTFFVTLFSISISRKRKYKG